MNKPGIALVFVLLLISAVELLTLSSLALATHEAVLTRIRVRTTIAERAADAALGELFGAWPIAAVDSLEIGAALTLQRAPDVTITVQRTAWGLYHATAHAHAGHSTIRRGAVLRKLDVARALNELSEAVEDTTTCELPVVLDTTAAVMPTSVALGGVRWDEIATIADSTISGSIQLTPDTADSPRYLLFYSATDLTITTGSGSGLMFVNGDLVVQNGVEFNGIIVVRGSATIGDDVRIVGALRTPQNGTRMVGRSQVIFGRCLCTQVLLETPAGSRLIGARRKYIPAF